MFCSDAKGNKLTGKWFVDKSKYFQSLDEVLEENASLQDQIADLTDQQYFKIEQYELDNYRELLELDENIRVMKRLLQVLLQRTTATGLQLQLIVGQTMA